MNLNQTIIVVYDYPKLRIRICSINFKLVEQQRLSPPPKILATGRNPHPRQRKLIARHNLVDIKVSLVLLVSMRICIQIIFPGTEAGKTPNPGCTRVRLRTAAQRIP